MRLLLDTHAFLWFVLDDLRLSPRARGGVEDAGTDVLISPDSYWEIAIKISLGKYSLAVPYAEFWRHGITSNAFWSSAHQHFVKVEAASRRFSGPDARWPGLWNVSLIGVCGID